MRRLKRRIVRLSPLAGFVGLSLFALSGCADEPSYAVRWRIEPRADDPTIEIAPDNERMTNATLCSRNGVYSVELSIFDVFNRRIDEINRPCFPQAFRNREAVIEGNPLPPGEYVAVMHGHRANGQKWLDCDFEDFGSAGELTDGDSADAQVEDSDDDMSVGCASEPPFCEDGSCVAGSNTCDCQSFTVREDEVTRLEDFVLGAPPECEDGIDSDGDGLVDGADPGCQAGNSEGLPVLRPELLFDVSFFGAKTMNCPDVSALEFSIDDELLEVRPCGTGAIRLSATLSEGVHTLAIVGLNAIPTDAVPREAITVERTFEFEVSPTGAAQPGVFPVDFSDVDFLTPIIRSARFTINLELPPDEEGGEPKLVQCTPSEDENENEEETTAMSYAIRLLDGAGEVVRPTVSTIDSRPLDGSLAPCVASQLASDAIEWGAYQVTAEAFNEDGELCFTNAERPAVGDMSAVPATPASLNPIVATQVVLALVEGAPDSCLTP